MRICPRRALAGNHGLPPGITRPRPAAPRDVTTMTAACPTTLTDPNRLFRDGLRYLLAGTRFAVAAEFGTPGQALAQAGESIRNRGALGSLVRQRPVG